MDTSSLPLLGSLLVAVMAVVIGLILEYKTGWFANHVRRERESVGQATSSQDLPSAIYNVRVGVSKIYGIHVDEVRVLNWSVTKRGKELHITAEFPKKAVDGKSAFITSYDVAADPSSGSILSIHSGFESRIDW